MQEGTHQWEKVFSCPAGRVGKLRILIAEDDPANSMVMSRLLLRLGYNVAVAECVMEALRIINGCRIDVLISDINFPDGTGYQIMEAMRACGSAFGIALTGYDDEESLTRSREAGFSTHLVKPIDFDNLQKLLGSLKPVAQV